jgi:hypothetical protein
MASNEQPSGASDRDPKGFLPRLEHLVVTASDGAADIWIGELAKMAAILAIAELRSAATYLTWIARRLGHPIPIQHAEGRHSSVTELIRLYVCGQRFRFDFNFHGLKSYVSNHADSPFANDALIQSFGAFAKLGLRSHDAISTLNHALHLPDADARVRQVCLAGVWAACTLPDQPRLLLDLANNMIESGEADGTVYFRRATAHRLLRMPDEALDDIDRALSLLPPGNNEINQDYLRERQLIGLVVQL